MKHRVFFSFHYMKDSWRAGQVRNMGVLEGNPPVSTNEWEEVKQKGNNNILQTYTYVIENLDDNKRTKKIDYILSLRGTDTYQDLKTILLMLH